jgi:hypothetical protein
MQSISRINNLHNSSQSLRRRLADHEIYRRIETIHDLRLFMEHHVFAVWDFMSLLKALQSRLTCVGVPWVPQGERLARRLINEIVLEEESDDDGNGVYISHFELYRNAMKQCGAETSQMDLFIDAIGRADNVEVSLASVGAPAGAQDFVKTTMKIVESGSTHAIAAAFTLGREDVIPVMFQSLVVKLDEQFPGELSLFQDYLERHIKLDEERHGPMSLQMLVQLCGEDPAKWKEAEDTVRVALHARIALWDAVADQIAAARVKRLREVNRAAWPYRLTTRQNRSGIPGEKNI